MKTPEQRDGIVEINVQRAHLAGEELVHIYLQDKNPIVDINPESKGQMQLVLTDMLLTLNPEDAVRAGLRMELKSTGAINDLTILGDIVGGQHTLEFSDFADARDYEFMRHVLVGIIKGFKANIKKAIE